MKRINKRKGRLINEPSELGRRIAGPEQSGATRERVEADLSRILDALQKISSGDPTVRIDESAEVELIAKLKRTVNLTAQNIGEIVDLSHEFAMVLSEHFDVLQRVSKGDLSARVTSSSQIELLESLKETTNRTIENISKEMVERKKAEKSIADALNFNKTILESSPVGIITYKASGDCISANEAAAQMVGTTMEELLAQNFRHLDSWKLSGMIEAAEDALKTGADRIIDSHFVTTFGKEVWFSCRFVPFQFQEELHLLLMLSDISERKKTEEELKKRAEQIRMLLDSTAEAIYGMDLEGNCTFVNAACLRMTGYDYTEVVGKNMHYLIHYKYSDGSNYPVEECKICRDIKQGRRVHNDGEVFWRSDRSSFPVEYWAHPVKEDGRIVGSVVTFLDITERKKAAMELEESERKLRNIVEHSDELFYSHDIHHRFNYVSPQSLYILGYTPEEMMMEWTTLITDNPINEKALEYTEEAIRTGVKQKPYLVEVFRKDGKRVLFEVDESPVKDKEGKVEGIVGAARDVTEHKKMEEALRSSEAELQNSYFTQATINMILRESLENIPLEEILQQSLNMILSIPWIAFEPIGNIQLVEDEPEVLVMKAQANISESLRQATESVPFGKCLCGKAAQTQEIQFTERGEDCYDVCHKGLPPYGHYAVPILFGGRTLGVLNVFLQEGHTRNPKEEEFLRAVADTLAGIIMRKKGEDRIECLAYYDSLTGLPNRNLFIDRLTTGIARAGHGKKLVGVLTLDIDRLKSINDIYGLNVGDNVLKEVARRLTISVREGDTVARIGGDDFGILLIDIAESDDVILVVQKIMKNASQSIQFQDKEIVLTLSVGISLFPTDGEDASMLIKKADLALGKAKQQGRKSYQFYTEGEDRKASEFVLLEKNLYNAMRNEEFILHYQPYWDINTKKLAGMEALIRWKSPELGLVAPGKFIPVLEDTRMIIEVGEWILKTAIGQVKEWQNRGYEVVPVSVNLSLVQFRQRDLSKMIERTIGQTGFYPSLLTLEMTESSFMQDLDFTNSVLRNLKKIGVSISIDDFGTGYSSLGNLKKFPIDNLKIDMSFIREIATDPDTASIVTAIINMAHTLNLKTIAEGIETEEQWKFLRLLRCDMGQGFYMSKPLPAEEVEKMLV